jgi:flagellar basal body-associated protein FliL
MQAVVETQAREKRDLTRTVLVVIAIAVVASVLGAGVAALVYFLTRNKNGNEVDPEQPRPLVPNWNAAGAARPFQKGEVGYGA